MDGPLAGRKRDQPNHQCKQRWYSGKVCCKKSYHKNVTKIRLQSVENMSLEASASKLERSVVFTFSPLIWRWGGVVKIAPNSVHLVYTQTLSKTYEKLGKF